MQLIALLVLIVVAVVLIRKAMIEHNIIDVGPHYDAGQTPRRTDADVIDVEPIDESDDYGKR